MAENKLEVIRVKKVVKGHGGHHGGSWKVAYADFTTSLLALFIVLWILSQSPEVRQAVAAYFHDPTGIPTYQPTENLSGGTGNVIFELTQAASSNRSGGPISSNEKAKLADSGKRIMKKILTHPTLASLSGMIRVSMTPDGLRIEISDQTEGTFFELGSAEPKEKLKLVIREIVKELKTLDNPIAIEGHTDARPYAQNDKGYSNWELSADRGNAVRRLMLSMGLPSERISEVRAYAERQPLTGSHPLDERNRRISILVQLKSGDENKPSPLSVTEQDFEPNLLSQAGEQPIKSIADTITQ